MRERQCTDELLLGIFVLLGIHGDGIGSADALVARTGVGHHGNHGATHTGVAGQSRLRDDVREDRLAENAVTQRAIDGLTQTVAVVALFALLGRTDIVVARLQDEADIIERCCGGKVPHHAQGQLQLFFLGTAAKASPLVQKHLAAGFLIDEMGVAAGNDRRCLVAVSLASHLDIEFLGDILFEIDVDMIALDIFLPLLEDVRCQVAQHLQLVFAFSAERTERNGYGQTDHPRTGDAYSHRVFQHVGTQQHRDMGRTLAQVLRGSCGTEGHGHWLCTANGGDNLFFYERDNGMIEFAVVIHSR